ncbi:MAG: oxaloacetate decarboxylase subunit alpha [Anaerolineae bacterium]|nr:oxaloacetate decarboxylase subunit alpha [Anaerolineae bacterium]MCB9105716.1 oxaloacetate decarboxylase subunit alpha [Anaerolineales bacterium]
MSTKSQFVDLTLRDGHQSLAATRMTTEQAMRVLPIIKDAGFAAFELWGGATLDSSIRFLDEDPWDRLATFKETLGGGEKIRALLRGQNLFGYQPSADDLVISFVKEAVLTGVGIMRIFDALNDWRNLQISILTTKAYGGTVEGAISYTTSPVHTTEYFVNFAKKLEEEGADQIAVKDMAGLLYPTDALDLFKGLKQNLSVPIVLHSHTTTGVACLNEVIGMHLGLDYIDTAITPFAGGTSHPPIEVMAVFAEEMGIDHGLDKALILKAQAELFKIFDELKDVIPVYGKFYQPVSFDDVDRRQVNKIIELVAKETYDSIKEAIPLMRELLMGLKYPTYDDKIFEAQVPGGMLSNLHNQLKGMGQLDRMNDILDEIPRVRADAGYVPLVTPTSQIVGSQAAFNVIMGERYKTVSDPFKMILKGEFGRTPAPVNPDIVAKVLHANEEPLKYRAASYLTPVMEDEYNFPFIKTHKDLLLYLLFGQSATNFLNKKYGLDG